jgi:hypothetical protein
MATNCSIELKKDKLPKLINKLEFFIFRAMESKGIDLAKVAKEGVGPIITEMLGDVKRNIIPSYIADYEQASKNFEAEGNTKAAEYYKTAAQNLGNMLAMWPKLIPNFIAYSNTFKVRNKFTLDEDGLVNMDDVADDEDKMLKKMVFDKPSNEVDPIEEINKTVELFIKSIPKEDDFDEYGYTSSIDYSSFVRNMFSDLENAIGLEEIIQRLEKNKQKSPEYQYIIDKLTYKPGSTRQEIQFRINFRNSFAKAFVPIYTINLEDNDVIKVYEAAVGKKRLFETIISSNFALRGMMVNDGTKNINLAHEEDGVWTLDSTDIPKILAFLDKKSLTETEFKKRRVEFLKGMGFEFSPKTEEFLINSNYLDVKDKFGYIVNHLVKSLQNKVIVTDPISIVKTKVRNLTKEEKNDKRWDGQSNNISDIIDQELKNNVKYNVEKSVITAEGTRMHSIQLHNNFTKVIKYLSDSEFYPSLQDILDSEPSMFWLDPVKNPAIRNSVILNSLFYFDPNGKHYGQRRRVTSNNEFSPTEGVPVKLSIVNTGGVKLNLLSQFAREGSSSTSLNELDKLLQDINLFKSKKSRITSVLRLGDKSTDLGISLDYYLDSNTGKAVKTPVKAIELTNEVFSNESFLNPVRKALQDILEMKYLRSKGFLEDMKNSSTALANTWGYFDSILSEQTKKKLDEAIEKMTDLNQSESNIDGYIEDINADITNYFNKYSKDFVARFNVLRYKLGISAFRLINSNDFENTVKNYLANTFIMDMEQMKVLFGDSFYFTAFHKRASKDSATGIFADVDENILAELNDEGNTQGYGSNTNLAGKRLAERVYQKQLAELEKSNKSEEEKSKLRDKYKGQRDAALQKQQVGKTYKSAVLEDVMFDSLEIEKIKSAYETLKKSGYVSEKMQKLYEDKINQVINDKYKGGTEADGQGKCTFDFYRIMSILTSQWGDEQETVYNKIVEYNHYDELADAEEDPIKKAEYIQKRNAVGYDPTEAVYFPPKKFQYAGPQMYERFVDGSEYATATPIFDKFSLQPLIPTNIKGTADEQLAKRMEYNGIGYIKFISGSKVEAPKKMDSMYVNYNPATPDVRFIKEFSPEDSFTSEQELFFDRFKEQVTIDAEIHENAIFGSQIRKLILMNIDRADVKALGDDYIKLLGELAELEKTKLYDEMGITSEKGKLKVKDFNKVIEYFFKEISKKNQDSNVRKVLKYDEATKKFELPLDGAVQAQVLEGIIISAINNRIVRYKTNGSMLIQASITGSDRVKFDKDLSKKALETYGNQDLKNYQVIEENGKIVVTEKEVKIALTGKWLNLLKLDHPDGNPIGSIERLNELLRNDDWVMKNKKKISMVSYRIPTQGRNFMSALRVKEFLPASAGDVIIMPSEVVIDSGADFDIDKMFVFYPNLNYNGTYASSSYTSEDLKDVSKYEQLKAAIQNKVYEKMSQIILHPANFIELVTPSTNYHILPIIDEIYKKLISGSKGRQKTDYRNTDILSREKNIKKFISLLKGKNDLGIAALANTFNVLFQMSKASGNPQFFADNNISTFFSSESNSIAKYASGLINNVSYADVYDEDGILKSEFFSEFINAFVDVANDDYVFGVNVVTELSPIAFYMKYMGLSSEKILNFMNQPAIRSFTKKMMDYQNKFVKAGGFKESARSKARNEVLLELGYYNDKGKFSKPAIAKYIEDEKKRLGITNLDVFFTKNSLSLGVRPDGDLSQLSDKAKLIQIAMIYEMENLKAQTNSMTEMQRALNFDSKPYASAFDAYSRNQIYKNGIQGKSVLNPQAVMKIKNSSVISPLDVYEDITQLLSELFPVRNDEKFNEFLHQNAEFLKNNYENKGVVSQDDMLKFARTAKNDFISYILQNFIDKSTEGKQFFSSTFETNKEFNEYMKELVTTTKLRDMLLVIRSLPDYEQLSEKYPFIRNIIIQPGENEKRITTFKIVENSSNPIEKESVIQQFEELTNLEDPEFKMVRTFFRNLALYSTFQSGLNTSDNSFTNLAPIGLVNKLYGSAVNEYNKLSENEKSFEYKNFYSLFTSNNPIFFGYKSTVTPTGEVSSKGKWYSRTTPLELKTKKKATPAQPLTPVNTKATVVIYDGTVKAKEAARNRQGVYVMRPNEGDDIPGVNENFNFGNPWSHKGYQGTIKTGSLSEAEAKALGTWQGDVTSTAISEAASNYEKWLKKEDFLDVEPERRDWILSIVNAGRLDNKNLIYFKAGYRSHADVLADFINNRTKQVTQPQVKGINIKSDKTNPNSLANRLTNPNWYSTGLMDVEGPYKAGKTGVLKDDMNLMYKLQVEKFRKNPELIDEINAQGGLEFIQNSSHEVGVKGSRWEGKGMESNFIKVLAKSYTKVAKDLGKFIESAVQPKQVAQPSNIANPFKTSDIQQKVYHVDKRKNLNEKTLVDDNTMIFPSGVFFTTEKEYAENYAKAIGGVVYEAYINVQKPLNTTDKQTIERLGRKPDEIPTWADSVVYKSDDAKADKYGKVGTEIVVYKPQQIKLIPTTQPVSEKGLSGAISQWIEKELPWKIETPLEEIGKMYEEEKLSGETIEEYLERIACNGKLK